MGGSVSRLSRRERVFVGLIGVEDENLIGGEDFFTILAKGARPLDLVRHREELVAVRAYRLHVGLLTG